MHTFNQKISLAFRQLPSVLRAVRLVWQVAPGWTLLNALMILVQGLLPLAALYLLKRVVDSVSAGFSAQAGNALGDASLWIVLAGGVALLTALARSLGEYAAEAQSLQVTDSIADIIHAQSIAVDLEYYEDAGYYDTLHRAQKEALYRPTRIVNGLIQVAQNCLSLLGILGLLVSFNGWLAALLVLASLPGALVRLWHSQRLYGFERAQTEKERRAWAYHNILTDVPYAKEIRTFNLGALFQARYRELREQIRAGKLVLAGRRVRADLATQVLTTAALFGSLAWIARQTLRGAVTLGDLMVYFLAFQNGLNFLQMTLKGLAGLYEDNLFITSLYQFLDLAPKISAPAKPQPLSQPIRRGISFRGVGFTYPSREQPSLENIHLEIAPGEVIALVGANGSGKTTLIKLLCRLYDPTQGQLAVDGVDLRELDPVQWRRQIGVTFQDYAHYAMTARENIWLGNIETPPDPAQIARAAERSGADEFIRRMPQGYETMLGHWFQKGQELSGGEWQKIALARAFWREASLLVLDEPTSSLDPLAEAQLFTEFRAMLDGRSAILISHRFSTVQMADKIYVLERGRIVESGTHAALLAQAGRYAHLYHTQAHYYQET